MANEPPEVRGHAPVQSSRVGPKPYEVFMDSVDHLVVGRGTYAKALTFDAWPLRRDG